MQKRVVSQAASDAGFGPAGVSVKINRDTDLIGRGLYGHTAPNGTITLYPDAFSSMEDLVRTIGHERMHVMQIGVYVRRRRWSRKAPGSGLPTPRRTSSGTTSTGGSADG